MSVKLEITNDEDLQSPREFKCTSHGARFETRLRRGRGISFEWAHFLDAPRPVIIVMPAVPNIFTFFCFSKSLSPAAVSKKSTHKPIEMPFRNNNAELEKPSFVYLITASVILFAFNKLLWGQAWHIRNLFAPSWFATAYHRWLIVELLPHNQTCMFWRGNSFGNLQRDTKWLERLKSKMTWVHYGWENMQWLMWIRMKMKHI